MTECVLWTGHRNRNGYGTSHGILVHRRAYEAKFGPIPVGMELDHLCRNRACYNTDHLEVVTHQENVRRGHAARGPASHCKAGHEFTQDNTRTFGPSWRQCIACKVEYDRARWIARKGATA